MSNDAPTHITVLENGPYLVAGDAPLRIETIGIDAQDEAWEWIAGPAIDHPAKYALCRCGASSKKPFCDGTHVGVKFDGTEVATHAPYAEQAARIPGPTLVLEDAEALCAFGRFCDAKGKIWNLVHEPGGEATRELVAREAAHCPSGRLVVRENGVALEPEYAPAIVLVEDPQKACSGPIALRGGIVVASHDGTSYETRNRVTLCRCGASANKPFCDGAHADVAFRDGLTTVA